MWTSWGRKVMQGYKLYQRFQWEISGKKPFTKAFRNALDGWPPPSLHWSQAWLVNNNGVEQVLQLQQEDGNYCNNWKVQKDKVKEAFVQFSSIAQSCLTPCDPINHSTPGLPVHHHLPEFTQTHVH